MNNRQMQRSGVSNAHHQRQYSDNFLDNGFWLQSNGAQQVRSDLTFCNFSVHFCMNFVLFIVSEL